MSTRTLRLALLPALLTLGLLVSACAPEAGAQTGSTPQPGQAAAPARETVRVGYLNVMDDAPVMLAADAGLYAQQGLDARLQLFSSGTDLIKAIVGGQLDAGVLGFTNALTWAAKGADLKIVGGAQMGYHSLLVRKDTNIKTLTELKGHSLATQQQGSTADIILNGVVLPAAGLKRQDVQLLYVSPSVAIESLAAGRVDAAFVFEPYASIARLTAPVTSIYEVGKEWPFPCMVVITSGKALQQNRTGIDRVLAAQRQAIDMLGNQPESAAGYLAPRFVPSGFLQTPTGQVPATAVIADAIRSQTFDWRITAGQAGRMQEIADMMVKQGILSQPVAVNKFLDLTWQEGAQ